MLWFLHYLWFWWWGWENKYYKEIDYVISWEKSIIINNENSIINVNNNYLEIQNTNNYLEINNWTEINLQLKTT